LQPISDVFRLPRISEYASTSRLEATASGFLEIIDARRGLRSDYGSPRDANVRGRRAPCDVKLARAEFAEVGRSPTSLDERHVSRRAPVSCVLRARGATSRASCIALIILVSRHLAPAGLAKFRRGLRDGERSPCLRVASSAASNETTSDHRISLIACLEFVTSVDNRSRNDGIFARIPIRPANSRHVSCWLCREHMTKTRTRHVNYSSRVRDASVMER